MTPYRDTETLELPTFAKHITIAETLLGVNDDLRRQLSSEEDPELRRSYLQTWGDLWEQLDQARAIARRLERDASAFDEARARAGDPYLAAAGMTPITDEIRNTTSIAILTLRQCFPEVVVPRISTIARAPQRRVTRLSPMFWAHVGTFLLVLLGALVRC